MTNYFKRIGSKAITYKNASPPKNQALILQRQLKYVEDIIVTIDTSKLGMSRTEVKHTISYIGQACSYVQAENHLDYLIWEKWLPNMKRRGWVMKSQEMTTEQSQIYVSQYYRCHTMIEAGWEDMQQTNSPPDILLALLVTFN